MKRVLAGLAFAAVLTAPASAATTRYDFTGSFTTSDIANSFASEGGFSSGTGNYSGYIIFDNDDPGPTDFTALEASLQIGAYSFSFADPSASFAGAHVDPPDFSILFISSEDFSAANTSEFLSFLISFPTGTPGIVQAPDPQMGSVSVNFAADRDALNGSGPVTQFAAAETSPVPEPGTWALMISGFGLIGAALRRRHPTLRVSPLL